MGVKVDEPAYCAFLAERVLTLIPLLEKEIPGVLEGEDIEHIHRMRVTSRRIRAALALLGCCLEAQENRRLRRSVRRVTRALGAARDVDVQIDFIVRYAARPLAAGTVDPLFFGPTGDFHLTTRSDEKAVASTCPPGPEDRMGIRCLLLRLVQEREALQPEVIRALDRLEDSRVLERMEERFSRRVERWGREEDTAARSHAVLSAAHGTVALRADELAVLAPALSDPARLAEHHALRIAAKRLRYTIEAFAPLFEDALHSEVKAIKALQEVLGDLHDCDVWINLLPLFLEKERDHAMVYFGNEGLYPAIEPGVKALLANRRSERVRVHEMALDTWNRLQREHFLKGLVERFATAGNQDWGSV